MTPRALILAQTDALHSRDRDAALARALGYGNPSHFIRAFRRWENASPGVWREMAMARSWAAMPARSG